MPPQDRVLLVWCGVALVVLIGVIAYSADLVRVVSFVLSHW